MPTTTEAVAVRTPSGPEGRPLDPISIPRAPARNSLRDRLVDVYGLAAEDAAVYAQLCVDPSEVRRRIEFPIRKPFSGGTAYFLPAQVWSPLVMASPVNPRETEDRKYPAAADAGHHVWSPIKVEPAGEGQPVLCLKAESRDHMEWTLNHSAEYLTHFNADLKEEIRQDGVLDPVTVCLAHVLHEDGTGTIRVATSIDGSTRTTHAHAITGFDPLEVLYRWKDAPDRDWRGRIGPIIQVQEKPLDELTDEEAAAHRALTYQGNLLVKVEPVRDAGPVDVVQAARAIVAGIHVSHPKEWPEGSQMDEISDAVLDKLYADGRVTADDRDYLKGLIHPDRLAPLGFQPHPDERAGTVLKTLYDPANGPSISAGYRGLVDKKRLGNRDKVKVATELIMRSFRSRFDNRRVIGGIRSALERTIDMSEIRFDDWEVSGRNPDELLEAALQELEAGVESLGADRLELGVLGTYWLISTRALRREGRHSEITSSPSTILAGMLKTERGLRQLHRAILEGRDNPTSDQPAPVVTEDGSVRARSGGGHFQLENDELRETYGESPDEPEEADQDEAPTVTPLRRLQDLVSSGRRIAAQVDDLVAEIAGIRDEDDVSLVMRVGVPAPAADDVHRRLSRAAQKFFMWGEIFREVNAPVEDEVDLLEDEEVA